jgi:hypothetical protein
MKRDDNSDASSPALDRIEDLLGQAFSAIDDRPGDAALLIRQLFVDYQSASGEEREVLDRMVASLADVCGPKLN